MKTYTIDTRQQLLRKQFANPDEVKAFMVAHCPIANRRGYSIEWTDSGVWTVCNIRNTKGKLVHALAFRPGGKR